MTAPLFGDSYSRAASAMRSLLEEEIPPSLMEKLQISYPAVCRSILSFAMCVALEKQNCTNGVATHIAKAVKLKSALSDAKPGEDKSSTVVPREG